jgi:hypothetical protein
MSLLHSWSSSLPDGFITWIFHSVPYIFSGWLGATLTWSFGKTGTWNEVLLFLLMDTGYHISFTILCSHDKPILGRTNTILAILFSYKMGVGESTLYSTSELTVRHCWAVSRSPFHLSCPSEGKEVMEIWRPAVLEHGRECVNIWPLQTDFCLTQLYLVIKYCTVYNPDKLEIRV